MKKFLFLCLTAMCCAFISCGDDDEPKGGNTNGQVAATIKETANQLVLTYTTTTPGFTYTTTWTCDFQNDKCVSSTMTQTYPSEAIAKMVYDELDDEDKRIARLSGRSVIIDMTAEHKDMTREQIKITMQAIQSSSQGGTTPVGPNNPNQPNNPNNPNNPVNPTPASSATITETATQLVLTFTVTDVYTYSGKWTCDFNKDDECTKSLREITYPTEDYAEMELRGLIAEAEEEGEETRYWRQGRVVYGDDTAEFEGESRQTIRFYMEMMKQEIITGGSDGEGEEVKAWKSFK
ncbi:MAG: hypothetical protein II170_06720 [Bacteroidaceae bacterium]|nr:hypothetical protein [Bacteroidaceae bacterium]